VDINLRQLLQKSEDDPITDKEGQD
jgi:hypothetical protein